MFSLIFLVRVSCLSVYFLSAVFTIMLTCFAVDILFVENFSLHGVNLTSDTLRDMIACVCWTVPYFPPTCNWQSELFHINYLTCVSQFERKVVKSRKSVGCVILLEICICIRIRTIFVLPHLASFKCDHCLCVREMHLSLLFVYSCYGHCKFTAPTPHTSYALLLWPCVYI